MAKLSKERLDKLGKALKEGTMLKTSVSMMEEQEKLITEFRDSVLSLFDDLEPLIPDTEEGKKALEKLKKAQEVLGNADITKVAAKTFKE